MQKDYQLVEYFLVLEASETIKQVVEKIKKIGWVDCIEQMAFSVYGERVKPEYILQNGDRIECCLNLPTDPIDQRRIRALKVKNR